MYFLLEACENPSLLRTLYFGTIIADLIFTIVPIALVAMLIIDFTKAIVAGNTEAQSKVIKLIPKRIMYAVIIFILPWIVGIFMNLLSIAGLKVGSDYKLCLKRARNGDFSVYDELLEAEEEAEQIVTNSNSNGQGVPLGGQGVSSVGQDGSFGGHGGSFGGQDGSSNSNPTDINGKIDNVYQCDGSWSGILLKGKTRDGDQRTICLSGCGFCSMTMVLRYLVNPAITPDVVVKKLYELGGGQSGYAVPNDFVLLSNFYGLEVETTNAISSNTIDDYVDKFNSALRNGKKLIVNKPDHYISVLGINSDGTLIVGDSSHTSGFNKRGPYHSIKALFIDTTRTKPYHWLNVTIIGKK